MLPENRDAAHLWDMLQAARAVETFVAGRSIEDYVSDLLLRSAVERQIEIIGEAARRVSRKFQESPAQIVWSGIVKQRHVLAHEYGETDHLKIWRVATIFVPELVQQLAPIAPTAP